MNDREARMKGLLPQGLGFVGASGGWWLGGLLGVFAALALSSIGAGIGFYYGRKWAP